MKKFEELQKPKELEFFVIDKNFHGEKVVHILGYTYESNAWHYVEMCSFVEPFYDFIAHVEENKNYVEEQISEYKQFDDEITGDAVEIINAYYGDKPVKYLDYCDIDERTPCGYYVREVTDKDRYHRFIG